jgi:uncharacterized protein (TIGR02453 family)
MKKTHAYLKKLKKHNTKEWFDANRAEYDAAREEFTELVAELISGIARFDKEISGLDARKSLFRINRDIRFSKDKTPYKTNFAADISPGGKQSSRPGYYVSARPGEYYLAGGSYMPEPGQLAAIRQEIDYNFKEFQKILSDKKFKKYFGGISDEGKLVNPPKGYDKDNPAAEILKNKHFILFHEVPEKIALSPKFGKYAAEVFSAMHPFLKFLRRAME